MSESLWIFGLHAAQSALENNPDRIKEVVILKGRQDNRMNNLLDLVREKGVKFRLAPREEFERTLQKQELKDARHQGVLVLTTAAPVLKEHDLDALLDSLQTAPLLLVLDGVTDPHNIGACLRTCDAAGAHGVIVPKDKSGSLTPTAVKIASGASDTVPFFAVTNLARTLESLKERGIWVYGTAGEASHNIYQTKLQGPLALVMGAEGKGLRRLTRDLCDELIHIPMAGDVSSLNVSVAAGVCLFEVVRQRQLA
ncbi:23S rRNA (guanosine(2251)-2'-O)-methyltransferase RlmB [Reinekea sp. G2M2-21]|uniref:23S rRNA (guanosine(2251)-2'-O)-methyltransferase RlmB n=1 Tax=Reinekea sp. G2M2-21 TaxID=2788942 RepID=UPI0018A8FED4|nr:23S rRNA (guanosine(2251)-2'-O)-methyltransferase RlmB [Reinekea sp. G2M2-21]MDX1341288.1 23S rRNA (guanosine(2251)-2'-O)-methyltransferase RlmB [Reinekea sp.]MDX1473145.1 23S rRNA (guanosine(2251)-2'-O)-methyltransferase RlmB [Reinekea sp.]